MTQSVRKTHKRTRTSQEWGTEYSYFERERQLIKAHWLMVEHHRGRQHRKWNI